MEKIQYDQWSEKDGRPRRFHSHFFNCFGACDLIGWASCCLASSFPCVAFGVNMTRTTGKIHRGIVYALLMLVLLSTIIGSQLGLRLYLNTNPCANTRMDSICTPDDMHEYRWMVVLFSSGSFVAGVALVFMGFSARMHIREALNMTNSEHGGEICEDFCAAWCFPMGLCQETRTLMYNRVQNGQWRGPEDLEHSIV